MSRKLASIRTVKEIRPIPNADAIELCMVDGWQVVSKKGEFSPNDTCVYFEIDSFLPVRPEFEFLRKSSFRKMGEEGGFRLKTIKLRGQISQGLILPVSTFDELKESVLGDDVTEALGVQKFEPPLPAQLAGEALGLFPGFIQKTDQERIQNLWDDYSQRYADKEFEVTIKLDGSSMTVYRFDDDFGVCSRNLNMRDTEGNTLWRVTKEMDLFTRLDKLGRNLALQGELMGTGIQKNREKINGHKYFIFDIFDIDAHKYLTPSERLEVLEELGLSIDNLVPVLETIKPFQQFKTVDEILKFAEGKSWKAATREGLVFKAKEPNENGVVVSFKAISNRFLLKHEE